MAPRGPEEEEEVLTAVEQVGQPVALAAPTRRLGHPLLHTTRTDRQTGRALIIS